MNAGHRGFIQVGEAKMASRAKPDLKESFIWGVDQPGPDGIPPNRWPEFLPEMRGVLDRLPWRRRPCPDGRCCALWPPV